MGQIKRSWEQNTMAAQYQFNGGVVEAKTSVKLDMKDILGFVAENWLRIPVAQRQNFKTFIERLELGIDDMPEPDDYPEKPPTRW